MRLALLLLLLPSLAAAQGVLEVPNDHGSGARALPLVEERVRVRIDGQYASTLLTQTYQNETGARLEGRYTLQLGEGALPTGFAYWNGEQKIVGEIFEKEVAEHVYAQVTNEGRDPGLFEQVGEGAFAFRVFPIEPAERKRVEVRFGRYLPRSGDTVGYRLGLGGGATDVEVEITDEREISRVRSSTHRIDVEQVGPGRVLVRARGDGRRELQLGYDVYEVPWQPRVLVHRDAGQDAYVVVSLAAPKDLPRGAVPAKDVTLVIDHSGSMNGEPMDNALAAARAIVGRLRAEDRVNVVLFDDGVESLFARPEQATPAVRAEAIAYLSRVRAEGGTNIAAALERTLRSQIADDRPDVILFLTDGQSDRQAALKVAHDDRRAVRLFTIGLGDGVDKPLLSRLAAEKRGRFTFIERASAIEAKVAQLFEQVESPVLLDTKIEARGLSLARVYPRTLPDLARGDELLAAGRASGQGPLDVTVSGVYAGKPVRYTTTVAIPAAVQRPWIGRSWARARIDDLLEQIALEGEKAELKNEAVELALAYELATPYTSFLAVPESELTSGARGTLAEMRARKRQIQAARKDAIALSRDDMPPGDPVLTVEAPADARQVTAHFPFGLVRDLAWDPRGERWRLRFLVPNDVPDGVYEAQVVIVLADGTVQLGQARYVIDSTAPDFEVTTAPIPGGVFVSVETRGEAARVVVAAVDDPRLRATLTPDARGRRFRARLLLPPGRHELRVVAADHARNEADDVVVVEVR